MTQKEEQEEQNYTVKPYSLKELAIMYGVSKNTYKKWLSEFGAELGERKGYYYSIQQVKLIFEKLGALQIKSKKNNSNVSRS